MNKSILDFSNIILDTIYPRSCVHCNTGLSYDEKHICWHCMADIKLTYYYRFAWCPTKNLFTPDLKIQQAISFVFFVKDGPVQSILHELKYNKNKAIGSWIGLWMAKELKEWLGDFDAIVALPIHDSKKKIRGYNQSELMSKSIAKYSGLEDLSEVVKKTIHNESQTNKSRIERVDNVKNVYEITNGDKLKNKKLIILDDVVTTGASLTSLVLELRKYTDASISILVFASQPLI